MEAVKVRKCKLKTDEIIARLESLEVPNDPLSFEPEECFNHRSNASEPNLISKIDNNTTGHPFIHSETTATSDQLCIYPSLKDQLSATELVENQFSDHEAHEIVEDTELNKVEASAPDLLACLDLRKSFVCDLFPSPLSSEHLKNLYINRSLDTIDEIEQAFLEKSEFELLAVPNSSGLNIPNDPFYLLLCQYADDWGRWLQSLKRLSKVLVESSEMKQSAWKVVTLNRNVESKCQDKRTVYLKYEYENATLSPSALSELKETNEVSRWIIFEEIPLIAYKLVLCRNRIEEYLANILTQCSIYENLVSSQPGILVGSNVNSVHLVQLNELRSTCSIIFACLRQFWSSQYSGRTYDPTFLKHLSNWLILTAGVTVRACRLEDHIFILMQLLRLPSQLIKLFACLLQPPDPVVAWERTKNLVEFLNQPEVELILTLFAICLRPVRERARFVTPVNITSSDHITHSSPDKHDTPWTLVDSAGESDTEEHDGVEFGKKTRDPTNKLLDVCILSSDYNPDHESCTYLNPSDLNCLLGQLRIERVLQLLAYDYIPQYNKAEDFQINESGFMTSIAFADRLLSLIEACEKIYSGYVPPPGPQTHLGPWRSLAKRLARLIRLLLITIGFRIQNIVYQQQYHHEQKSQQFALILSQYDLLCIRAVNCLLLSGSGLPEVYQKAGQLTCWRNLACTIPLGVTMVKTKKELFYIILKSILQNIYNDHSKTNEDSIYQTIKEYIINSTTNDGSNDLENVLPNLILNKLHHSLLSMGFNELGLSVVISVLGKFASLECRPRIVYCNDMPTLTSMNTLYRYELPEDEASLIKCIMRIIFGLSVYRKPKDVVSQNAKINANDSSAFTVPSDSSTSVLSLLPISPKYGCKQLIEITNKHPQICLHLLYNLIIESALDLSSNPLLTTKLHERIAQLNLYFSEQFMRVEEILLQLAVEAPFHIMQPSNEETKFLINSLCHYSESCFLYKLCRLLLSRFSWDAFKDLQSDEPFIPLKLHLDTALGLCEIVDKHVSDLSHFHLSKLISAKLVSNIYKSAKSSMNMFTASLTDHFLSSLHISQQRLRIKSSGLNRLTNVATELSRRTHSVEDITVPPSASSSIVLSNSDQNLSSLNDVIDWAAELLLRLLIPGSKYDQNYITGTHSGELKEYINQIWLKLYALHERKKCNHKSSSVVFINPITSFVMLSLQTVYTVVNNNNNDNSTKPTSTTTNDCLLWQPQSSILGTLLKSIFSYKHFKLTLRTLFILFKYIPGSSYFDENNHLKSIKLLYPELKESLHDLLYWSPLSTSFESSSLLFSEVEEQRKHLQQFLSMLYQHAQNPVASSSLSSVASSSSKVPIDSTLFFPYLLIGMFVELTTSTQFSHLSNIIKIFMNILLDPVDCFTHLQITVLLDLLITFEYWNRLKFILSVNNIPIEHFNTNITTHGLEKYKTKLSLTNTSVYDHFQFKFKEIQEFHAENRSTGSLHNAIITSLESAYSWAWSQTSFIMTTLKSNLINSSTLPYQKDDPTTSNRYSAHNESKLAVLHECIFNKINFDIIQTYIKHLNNNFQLTPPFWLLAWIQSLVYTEETMKNDTLNSAENKTNCQYLNFWEHIAPLIALYQDELISAGNQFLVNNLQSSLRTESTSLSTPVKQILQKILLESGLIQLIPVNSDYKSSSEDPQKQDDICRNQTSTLSDTNIAWIFSQFSLVQGVYLVHLCPVNHPLCLLLIHNVLCQIFNLINPLSIVADDTNADQRNHTSYVYNSSSKSRHNSSFTPGFLLLRCLPASLFIHSGNSSYLPLSSSSATSSLNKQDYQQSLFQLIIQKIRLILSNDHYQHSNKLSFTQDFNCLIDFLCQLDIVLSRSSFLNVTGNNSISKFSHMLDPGYQQSVIDILLYHFDWPSLNSFMQTTQALWNTYQYMHKLNMKIPNDGDQAKALSSVSPESSILRLQNNEPYERRMELSRSSFEVLFSSSSLMTLPSSLDQFPQYMKDTLDLLRQHAKQMCDRNECFEKLQNEFYTNILPKLYVPIRVKLSQYVECQSILPSWMPGHQPCSGGSNISCEYQTDRRNEEIGELCQMNKSNIDKLIKVTLDVSRAAVCDVLNCNDYPSSTSVKIGSHSTLGINWSRTVLQLQNAVSYLVHKSRLVTSELKNSNTNLTPVPCASATTTTTDSNTSTTDQLNLVHSIGLQCFQQLCQNFSGPLLQCPLTKQVLSNCVGELACEFLTNLSTQHQLILDMLVALPHLASLLSSTFSPPNPSLCMNNNQSQHPLVPVYQRLMDIRFRCNAQTALIILEKINFRAWFSIEIKNFSQEQWSQLILALFNCIQETSAHSSEITSTCSEENHDLHKLCIVHLKALLSNHFSDMFILSFELLLQNLSNPKCVDIWILLQDLLTADINVHSGSTSLSVEQLSQLLNHVHRRLTSASSDSASPSSSLCDTQSGLIDECYFMLKNNSPQTIQLIVHFLMILACQLCEKIGCCILYNHLSIQNGQSIIIDILVRVFGCILQKCISLYYNDKRNITAMSSTISSSSESTQTSYLLSSSFILYVKCCLEAFSECLNSAIKSCPTDKNQLWTNQLINLFLIWFTSTTCILNNVSDSLKIQPISSTTTSNNTTCKQDLCNTALPLIICSSINEIKCYDNANSIDEEKNELTIQNHEFLSRWCMSFTSCVWMPNLDCLDSMIMLLLSCDHLVNHQLMRNSTSNFLIYLLVNVQWWLFNQTISSSQSTNVPEQRIWFKSQSNTLHLETMIKMDEAYVNSLTFLIVLIASCSETNGANKDAKTQLKVIMENIQSSLDLSVVSESCYLYILSYLSEQHLPPHYVLMPPTTMEGRLFGLLAAAGGMIAKSSDLFTFEQDPSFTFKPSTGLYPNIKRISSKDNTVGYKSSSIVNTSLHAKRSAYLHKITSLLGHAVLCDNNLLLNELDHLLITDNFLESFVKIHTPSSLSATKSDSSVFSVIWNKMSSVMYNLTNNLNINRTPTTALSSSSSPTSIDNSLIRTEQNSSQSVKILTWVRICNLLSELEAVAGQIGWEQSISQEFKQIVNLCNEIISLVNRSSSYVNILLKLENSKIYTNNTNKNYYVYTPDYFINVIIFWLLNDLTILTHISINKYVSTLDNTLMPPTSIHSSVNKTSSIYSNISNLFDTNIVMPHSINARLSKPFIYSLLSMNSLIDQETIGYFVQLLNATIWSVIENAPSEILPKDRFQGICEIYSRIYFVQNKLNFLHSDLLVSMCIQNSLHLPLLFIILCRLNYLYRSTNSLSAINEEYNVIIADSLHWLISIDIYYMNGIEDRSFQLNGWILFLNFIIQLISTSKVNFFHNEPCCSNHPAWRTQQINKNEDSKNDDICSGDFHCKRLYDILNKIKNNLVIRRKKKKINITEEQIIQLEKLHTFIESLCCILEAWMINTHSVGLLNLENLSCLTSSTASSDNSRIEDVTNMEEGNFEESTNNDTLATQDKSTNESNLTASIISSLLIRLKSFTLIEAYQYLCLQLWTDLKPCIKQILQNYSTTAHLSSLQIV